MRQRTSVENKGGTLQVKGEGDLVGTDGDALSNAIMVVNFVTVILQFSG